MLTAKHHEMLERWIKGTKPRLGENAEYVKALGLKAADTAKVDAVIKAVRHG